MNFNFKLLICALMLTTGWCGCSFFVNLASQSDRDVEAASRVLTQRNDFPLAIAPSSSATADTIRTEKLEQLLARSIDEATYEPSTEEEIARFEKLLLHTLKQPGILPELEKQWSIEGWELIHWTIEDQSFIAICEVEQDLRGRGFYVIRINSNSNIVLQAPHRFYDIGSGTIVSELFQENDCQAAAWNTVHRKQFDLAHSRDSVFNAFTRAIMIHNDKSIVVQIHGFENDNQKGSTRAAALIVSNTTEYPGRIAREAAIRFKENFGSESVRLYPLEVRQLGGTKNEQASVVYEMGSVGFLHLELNKNFRAQLLNSADLRAKFFNSLAVPASFSGDSNSR